MGANQDPDSANRDTFKESIHEETKQTARTVHTHSSGSYAVSHHLMSHDNEAGAVTSLYLSMKRMILS